MYVLYIFGYLVKAPDAAQATAASELVSQAAAASEAEKKASSETPRGRAAFKGRAPQSDPNGGSLCSPYIYIYIHIYMCHIYIYILCIYGHPPKIHAPSF